MHPIQQKLLELSKVRDLSKLSIREIGRQIADGDARVHPQLVKYHVQKLVDTGVIDAGRQTTSQKLKPASVGAPELISIPIVGSANCGPATIFAEERIRGYIKISSTLLRSKSYQNLFALEASGDSMNLAQVANSPINDGDYVIIDHSRITPRNGEYVVVIDNDNANIKKLFLDHRNEQVVLMSESSENYAPIFINPEDKWGSLISGTVVQVVKKPQ